MPAFRIALVTAALIGLGTTQLQAAPAGLIGQPNRATQIQGGNDLGSNCPAGHHYACWYDPYGQRFCGCWPGFYGPACPTGYHFACRVGPNGRQSCGCY